MADASATTTYHIPEPFHDAVEMVRRTLVEAGLKITGQLNMSERLQRRLQVNTPPCHVLFVGPSVPLSRDIVYTPLHVVISARGSHSEIHILRVPLLQDATEPDLAEVGRLRAEVGCAIERIAMRALIGV